MRTLAAAVLAGIVLSASSPTGAEVRWRSGERPAPVASSRAALREALAVLAARPDESHVVVQLASGLAPDERRELRALGVRLLGHLGGNAWFATLLDGIDIEALAAVDALTGVEAIGVADKLHPDLLRGAAPPWAVVDPARRHVEDAKGTAVAASDPEIAVYVLFHRDVDARLVAEPVLARHGGVVRSRIRAVNGVVAHLRLSRVPGLADEDAVMWVEPPLPALEEVNAESRARVGADTLQAAPHELDGSGVTVLVYDSGQVFAHGDFAGRLTIGASDTDGLSEHSTHVAGTVAGDGSGSSGQYRGMAPGAGIVSYGFQAGGGDAFLYTDPGDIEADYTEAILLHGADLSNNSIGNNTAVNGHPCEWEGDYGVTAALLDEIVRGSTGAPFRAVFAAGNERSGSARCGATYHTTAPPANAKNPVIVGALNSDDDSVTDFTSWGPSDDGRLKPDVAAPGCQNGGDTGVTSTSSSGGYAVLCGTSMASPAVAGVAALLLERHRASFPGREDLRNATLKAILANTAADLSPPGPDYRSGYGSIRAVPAADAIAEGRFVEAEVEHGGLYAFRVVVGAGEPELKVTVAWDDPAGIPNVDPALVNDLDLRVIDPGGGTHLPWTLDPANPEDAAVRTQRDGVNNIEQVAIDGPVPGTYVVEVEGFNVTDGPAQPFGAAASATVVDCSSAGRLSSARRVSCSGALELTVVDCDLDADGGVVETTVVSAASDSEPVAEAVTLTETAPDSAELSGSIALSTVDSAGVLQVAEGDTVTATYVDADDGRGGMDVPVVRAAVVDCTTPDVTGVSTVELNPRNATVRVTTDEAARVTISYGSSCGSTSSEAEGPSVDTTHDVKLFGLDGGATYFFTVTAEDEAGNVTVDDNAGACHSFTTPAIPVLFTELFAGDLDLEGLSVTLTPDGSGDFYAGCVGPLAGQLPVDTAGGFVLGVGDDQPTAVALADGRTVDLYGQPYGTVWIAPNGYLTFLDGDVTYSENIVAHFAVPRVAALFDDLDPGSGGEVLWKQLSDRVVVTWEGVPERTTTNTNTFQVEMFFDGRIRMSWLELESDDALAGVSAGVGVDPDFLETDLSALAACAPAPPTVHDLSVAAAPSVASPVTLAGTDDGQPPPASLTFRIVELPTSGVLRDAATGTLIDTVPYDLVAGGRELTYTPPASFRGADAFAFAADDGGAQPDGGESGPATVSIAVGNMATVHAFLTDDADPGWSTTGEWSFGPPTGGGSGSGDPTAGATGGNVYGYNLAGDYPNGMGQELLTGPSLDLSGTASVELSFSRWLGVESAEFDHAAVQLTTDGATWTTLWDHTSTTDLDDGEWTAQSFDLSALADDRSAVRLRWIMGPTDAFVTYPGWNLDDIVIRGIDLSPIGCFAAPGEVPSLKFSSDAETLVWLPAAYRGGTTLYDVIRSDDPDDFRRAQSGATCIESDDGSDTMAIDTSVPAPGQLFHYRVRGENACGEGPLGGGHDGLDCS